MTARWPGRVLAALATALLLLAPSPARAQIDPTHDWRTLTTRHFHVHFTPPIEPLARRVAADAERAYDQLSQQFHPPRGMIDVVISDDVDVSNGSATPFPTNRIVIFASPPVSESALRYTNDWAQMVITHELTHIFQLDRTRGIWSLGQHVFGRAAALFPNLYDPSWLTEGLAVYEESHIAGAGRIEGSEHRMIARAAEIDARFPQLGSLSLAYGRFPFGETAYGFGSLFVDFLARTQGQARVRDFVEKSSAELIPYLLDVPARRAFGTSFTAAWDAFRDSVAESIRVLPRTPVPGWRELTHDGVFVSDPRWLADTAIVYSGTPGRETNGAYRVDVRTAKRTRVGRRNSESANVPYPGGGLLYAQLEFVNPYQERSDLWIQHGRHETQLTHGQRLATPDVRADGEIVAEQILPGATRLVRVSRDGKRITPITTGSYDELWTEPRWSHSGTLIVASRWLRGDVSQIVVLDTLGYVQHIVSSGTSIESHATWTPGDSAIVYASDRTGSTQLYLFQMNAPAAFADARTFRIGNAATGLFDPDISASDTKLAAAYFRSDGYHLGVAPCCARGVTDDGVLTAVEAIDDTLPSARTAPLLVETGSATHYSPWRTLAPRYWLPTLDEGIDGGYRFGATTTGTDVIGRHAYTASLGVPLNNRGGVVGDLSYEFRGFGLPVVQLDLSRDWESLQGVFSRDPQEPIIGEIFRRTTSADLLATWTRQRVRTFMSITGGGALEARRHFATPSNVLALADTGGAFGSPTFPTVIGAISLAAYSVPPLAFSVEDGAQLNVTVRDRTRSGVAGTGGQSFSTVGVISLFKSLDLPGYAHHVIALRGAAGYSDENAAGYYSVGGISGSTFEVIPGYTAGEGRKTFPVRGYDAGTIIGTRAFTGSAEYRLPLLLSARGVGSSILPFFLDRSSLTVFGDYGTAWCPTVVRDREVCNRAGQTDRIEIASFGAELNVNLGVLTWDTPTRFRLGIASPMENVTYFRRPSVQGYIVAGVSF